MRFLDDKVYQAEMKLYAIRYGRIAATVKLNEDYMEWHMEDHNE